MVPPLPREASVGRHTSVRGLKRQSERKRDREPDRLLNGDWKVGPEVEPPKFRWLLVHCHSVCLTGGTAYVLKRTGADRKYEGPPVFAAHRYLSQGFWSFITTSERVYDLLLGVFQDRSSLAQCRLSSL